MIIAATDGSSLSNPGPAGWAWVISEDCWAAGGWAEATNNQAELMAVLDLLNQTKDSGEPLTIQADSQYVINSLTKWLPGWKKKNWKKADGKPVLNVDLLTQLDEALVGREVTFEWVKGHDGHELNELADTYARDVASAYKDGQTPNTGPGFITGQQPQSATKQPTATPENSESPQANPNVQDPVLKMQQELKKLTGISVEVEPINLADTSEYVDEYPPSKTAHEQNSKPSDIPVSVPQATPSETTLWNSQTEQYFDPEQLPNLLPPDDSELNELLNQLMLAFSTPDASLADEVLSPDYVEVDSSCAIKTRSQVIAQLASGKPMIKMPSRIGFDSVEQIGQSVLLGRSTLKLGAWLGVQTTIWVYDEDQCQCRFRQTTVKKLAN